MSSFVSLTEHINLLHKVAVRMTDSMSKGAGNLGPSADAVVVHRLSGSVLNVFACV